MKTKISIMALLLVCIALFATAGCSNTVYITDIAGYENMQSGGDKIEVNFENGTQYGFNFTIEDKTEIDEIVNIALTTRLKNLGKNSPVVPGDNTFFKLYQGENIYVIALSGVWANENRYAFTTNDLRDKINTIAEERGAFGNITDFVLYDNAKEWIKEEFENKYPVKGIGFVDDDSKNDLPETRTFIVPDRETFESIFIDDITELDVDFDREILIVYTFTTEYVLPAEITYISLNDKVLTIDYRIKLITETGSAVRPFQRWFVVKLDKFDITSVIVNEF